MAHPTTKTSSRDGSKASIVMSGSGTITLNRSGQKKLQNPIKNPFFSLPTTSAAHRWKKKRRRRFRMAFVYHFGSLKLSVSWFIPFCYFIRPPSHSFQFNFCEWNVETNRWENENIVKFSMMETFHPLALSRSVYFVCYQWLHISDADFCWTKLHGWTKADTFNHMCECRMKGNRIERREKSGLPIWDENILWKLFGNGERVMVMLHDLW